MATMITSECINCGACEPECPNTAIYQGGVEYELDGKMRPPLAEDIFYIVPEKCTECVGFYEQEACAAVCPVDCCVPNPDIPETEEQLIEKARKLHPDVDFPPDFPSRFRAAGSKDAAAAGGGDGSAGAAAVATAESASSPEPAAAAASRAAAGVAAPGVSAPKPAAVAPPKPAPASSPKPAAEGRVERKISGPEPPPRKTPPAAPAEERFPGELEIPFEEAVELARRGGRRGLGVGVWLLALLQPLLGALPEGQKRALEQAVGDRRFFSTEGATGLNALQNMILYPAVMMAVFAAMGRDPFSKDLNIAIVLGLALAALETYWRMREGFHGQPLERVHFRGAVYGLPLAAPLAPIVSRVRERVEMHGSVGVDGFHEGPFEEKLERERRYGEVWRIQRQPNGYLVQVEFPRRIPPSRTRDEMGLGEQMPDYDYRVALLPGALLVEGHLRDEKLRKLAAVSPAFPPDFTTRIPLPGPVVGFRHRYRDKLLEVVLLEKLGG